MLGHAEIQTSCFRRLHGGFTLHPVVTKEHWNISRVAIARSMRSCEEQGTGIDKVIVAVELHQLPPPDFRVEGDAVRAVLYAPRRLAEMTPQERVRT